MSNSKAKPHSTPEASRLSAFDIETKRLRAIFKRELASRKMRNKRFATAYENIVDLIGNPLDWPESICSVKHTKDGKKRHANKEEDFRRLFISENLKHGYRFKLTVFLLGNGVPPHMIKKYYKENGSLRDASAKRSVETMFKNYQRISVDFARNTMECLTTRKWSTFDLINNRWEDMDGNPVYANKHV